MIKKFIKNIINLFAKLVAFLISPFVVKGIKSIINSIYTQYIIKQLKMYGKNPMIQFPLTSIYGLKYISLGDDFYASSGLILEAYDTHLTSKYNPEITIGHNVRIGNDCHIGCVNKIVIGNNILIASKVFITDHFHGDTTANSLILPPNLRKVISKGPVVIEDNVWIGEGVAIMPNVRIGKNAIIGANSVVTKDVPPNCVVGGNPAKTIKQIV
jgi:acetyltransferase-like isoleucine patch superfamily enzyme